MRAANFLVDLFKKKYVGWPVTGSTLQGQNWPASHSSFLPLFQPARVSRFHVVCDRSTATGCYTAYFDKCASGESIHKFLIHVAISRAFPCDVRLTVLYICNYMNLENIGDANHNWTLMSSVSSGVGSCNVYSHRGAFWLAIAIFSSRTVAQYG